MVHVGMSDSEKPYKISASQINAWNDCKRKWAWKYIAKIYPDPHPAAALGTEVHALLEEYVQTKRAWAYDNHDGTPRKAAYIAAEALAHLPPLAAAQTEVPFEYRVPGNNLIFNGYRDLLLPGVAVYDYKTTSDFRWAKTETTLLRDPQAVIYAHISIEESNVDAIDATWLYLRTRNPTAQPVTVTFTKEHAALEFSSLVTLAKEISHTHSTVSNPLALEPTPTMCRSYGGCPYQGRCNLGPVDLRKSLFTLNTPHIGIPDMSILEKLRARQAAGTPATTASPTPVPAIREEVRAEELAAAKAEASEKFPVASAKLEALKDEKAAEGEGGGVTADDLGYGPETTLLSVGYGPINPPESVFAVAASEVDIPAPIEISTEPPKAKKTRRTKAQIVADKAPEFSAPQDTVEEARAVESGAVSQEAPEDDIPSVLAAAEWPAPEGYVLYIDCRPSREIEEADDFIAEAKQQINEAASVSDYREIEYGKGTGRLSKVTQELVNAANLDSLYLCSSTPEGQAVLSALVSTALEVVRVSR